MAQLQPEKSCQNASNMHEGTGEYCICCQLGLPGWESHQNASIALHDEKSNIDWRTSHVYCRPDFVPLPWQVSHFTLRAKESFLQQDRGCGETLFCISYQADAPSIAVHEGYSFCSTGIVHI